MNKQLHIELKNLRKVYPRLITEQLSALLLASLGRPQDKIQGGVRIKTDTLRISNKLNEIKRIQKTV